MKKQLPFLVFVFYFLFVLFGVGSALCADAYRIILKNGEKILVRHYEMQGDNIVLYKSWGSISFKRSEVAKIEKDSYTPSSTDDAPNRATSDQKQGKKRSISEKTKDDGDTELAKCRKRLNSARNSVRIYCAQADAIAIAPAPNLPQANVSHVSEQKADQFKAHVQSKVESFKANRNCNYYKDLVADLEKQCGD